MNTGISFKDLGAKRRLEDMHANELRAKLEAAGVAYSDTATKQELIVLVQQHT